jgi:tagatose 1,6-diphosphate aldolase
MPFTFLDPGPLVDDELELIAPEERYIPEVLRSASHPATLEAEPLDIGMTRRRLEEFLRHAPHGHEPPDRWRGRSPAYHFWMKLPPLMPLVIAGSISLRIGNTQELELYSGNIGYHVYPAVRGHHYAERASRLLLPLARRHGMTTIWITCNPENIASRRTCERLGATLVDIVNIPRTHEFYSRGERQKCRYRLILD